MEHWPLILGVGLTAATGLWVLVRRRSGPDSRLAQDAADPYRRWVQNVFLLVTIDRDYGHLPGAEARRVLAHWWEVYGPLELRRTQQELSAARSPEHAWPLVRFILVSRLGAAAGMIDDDTSWDEIRPVARRLQGAYPGWRAMAQAYLQARRQWLSLAVDGSEDDEGMLPLVDNLAHLDDTRWSALDFHSPLHPGGDTDQDD
ncbi:MAG: DUF1266 domain-containing protein [Deltaproteobacteria bacterium]|nr:DUF1266 domain-containing protein [Deltaproteobacteria bacterium]